MSGSALRWEGHVTVFHYAGGPCYRCVFPEPPPAGGGAVEGCGEVGVLGVVPGVMGAVQAGEVVKVAAGWGRGEVLSGRMVYWNARLGTMRTVRLRERRGGCGGCGEGRGRGKGERGVPVFAYYGEDYVCERPACLAPDNCVRPLELVERAANTTPKIVVVDVRPEVQFSMCSIKWPNFVVSNVPFLKNESFVAQVRSLSEQPCSLDVYNTPLLKNDKSNSNASHHPNSVKKHNIYLICRRGVASSHAVTFLAANGVANVVHVVGGLHRWREEVDEDFPDY